MLSISIIFNLKYLLLFSLNVLLYVYTGIPDVLKQCVTANSTQVCNAVVPMHLIIGIAFCAKSLLIFSKSSMPNFALPFKLILIFSKIHKEKSIASVDSSSKVSWSISTSYSSSTVPFMYPLFFSASIVLQLPYHYCLSNCLSMIGL